MAADATAQHAAAQHVAADATAQYAAAAQHVAVDAAAAQHDGPDADGMPQLGQELHRGPRAQSKPGVRGSRYDAAEQHAAKLLEAGAAK